MSDLFDAAASGVKVTDFAGCLLLLTPTEYVEEIKTVNGPTDVVVADIVVLDGESAGQEHAGSMIFPKMLKGQLRGKVGTGRYVLGRLGRGTAKPGQSAPWVLAPPTDPEKDVARRWLTAAGKNTTPPPPPPPSLYTLDAPSEIPF